VIQIEPKGLIRSEELMTTKELCEWLKISKATASNWRKQGMPYTGKDRSLRYAKSEVQQWLDSQKRQ
jgi:predicted site-specific integrase-resolvase